MNTPNRGRKLVFVAVFLMALGLLSFAPPSLAEEELCTGNSANCCTPPELVIRGGGCRAGQVWIGDGVFGTCQTPVACAPGTKFLCSNNSCFTGSAVCADPIESFEKAAACCPEGNIPVRGVSGWSCAALADVAQEPIDSAGCAVGSSIRVVNDDGSVVCETDDGSISLIFGTATTPSHSWTGDLNTGMYRWSDDVIRFSTGGTDRVSISSSGISVINTIGNSAGTFTGGSISTIVATGSALGTRGVWGISDSGDGVRGDSNTSYGIYGATTSGNYASYFTGGTLNSIYSGNGIRLNGVRSCATALRTNASGDITCGAPATVGDITDILAGTGITVTNGSGPAPTISADTAVVQQRITPAGCAVNSSIRIVNADGSVVCELDDDGGPISIVFGTPAAPSHSWRSELSTGMFRQAAGVMGFSSSGAERARIDGGGMIVGNTATTYANGNQLTVDAASEGGLYTRGVWGMQGVGSTAYGVYGETTSGPYAAVFSGGSSVSVLGTNAGSGRGVQGTANTGDGVRGVSTTGNGVYGTTTSGSYAGQFMGGNVAAVYAQSLAAATIWGDNNGAQGYGVSGTSINDAGVHGYSADNFGVYGESDNNAAVRGLSTNHYGVFGTTLSTSNNDAGVYGYSTTIAEAIRGRNTGAGDGVYGLSNTGRGVFGESTSSNGIRGVSSSSYGVYGITTTGAAAIYGISNNTSGVQGQSTNSNGVYGTSTSQAGVYGRTTSGIYAGQFMGGSTAAVYGNNSGATAIYGQNTAGGYGVAGTSVSGIGVSGGSTSQAGVYGTTSRGIYAGQFEGGSTAAVYGNNSGATAIYGQNTAGGYGVAGTSVSGIGVSGGSTSQAGVYGTTSRGIYAGQFEGGSTAAVYGNNSGATAIYGQNTAGGYGVAGTSVSGIGVSGGSTSQAGVYGTTSRGIYAGQFEGGSTAAVYGKNRGMIAIYGQNTAGGYGVGGTSVSNYGVAGSSQTGNGVYGSTLEGDYGAYFKAFGVYSIAGVYGENINGAGVYGYSTNEDGVFGSSLTGDAVRGRAMNNGNGVYGSSETGVGVYARSNTNYAIRADTTDADDDNGGGIYAFARGPYAGYFTGGTSRTIYSEGWIEAMDYARHSDVRIKKNQEPITYGLDEVMLLQPKSYDRYLSHFDDGKLILEGEPTHHLGFIAQEVYEIIPEAVSKPQDESKELWALADSQFLPILVKAIQELKTEKDAELKEKDEQIASQNLRIENLEKEIREIKASLTQ